MADAELDAEVAVLEQPSGDQRRRALVGDFASGGLEGLALKHLFSSAESRKIGAYGCIGVLVLAIAAAVVVDHFSDTAPKLSVASALEKRKPRIMEVLGRIQTVGDRAAAVSHANAPAPSTNDTVVLNLSGQPGETTATLLDLRQIASFSDGPPPRLVFTNPRYEGVRLLLAPGFTQPTDTRRRVERVQYVRYHAAWLEALRYIVVARDVVAGESGLLEGLVLVYQLEAAELIGSFPVSASPDGDPERALLTQLAAHFTVFNELGEKVQANSTTGSGAASAAAGVAQE